MPDMLTLGGAVAGALAPAATLIWRLSGKLAAQQAELDQIKAQLAAQKVQMDELEDNLQEHIREQSNRWNEINRTLGKIEGLLTKNHPLRSYRLNWKVFKRKRRKRPGRFWSSCKSSRRPDR